MKNTRISLVVALAAVAMTVGCSAQKDNSNAERSGDRRGGPPSTEEIMKMDANEDGKLAKDELEGPLSRDFAKIDTDKDGFISREELENAPKPQRGQGPPRR